MKYFENGYRRTWECASCGWRQVAHRVYGWQSHDDRAVEVHVERFCKGAAR